MDIKISKEKNESAWLEERRKGVGGSDVASILGLSKYRTPLDIYNDKIFGKKVVQTPAMKAGLMLENVIADWWVEETGRTIRRDNKIRVHKTIPFLLANIDRIIVDNDDGLGSGILEVKTASFYAEKYWDDEPPIEYTLQLQHYLDVLGYKWGEFAVLIGGVDFRRYFVQRDEELIALKNEKLKDFWENHILKQIPPEPISENDVKELYPKSAEGKSIIAKPDTYKIIEELKMLKSQEKELGEKIDSLETSIKIAMGDAEILSFNGDIVATYKSSKDSVSFNSKLFKQEQPDLYGKYCESKLGLRRFLIK